MKLIKILLTLMIMEITSIAQTIVLQEGWQLKGTETGFIHMDLFQQECINTVWVYDANSSKWQVFTNNETIKALVASSDLMSPLTTIKQNDGFWINATADCNVTKPTGLPTDIQDQIDSNTSTLSQDVIDGLTYMGNEERLAFDIYKALFALYPTSKQFNNIAINSEVKHIDAVQQLLQKYNINDTELSNNSIEDMTAGSYTVPAVQTLYDVLYAKGASSEIDALKVGCMVEVTDIDDLEKFMNQAETINATDVVEVYQFLIEGSYNHYWAFDKGLKNKGMSDGCCSLGTVDGVNYCHSEYPSSTNGN